MASSAELKPERPKLLPADFDQWDGSDVPETLPEDFNEFDGAPHSTNDAHVSGPRTAQGLDDPMATAPKEPSPSASNAQEAGKSAKPTRQRTESRREPTRAEKNNWTKVEPRRNQEAIEEKADTKADIVSRPAPIEENAKVSIEPVPEAAPIEEARQSKAKRVVVGFVLLLIVASAATYFTLIRKPAKASSSNAIATPAEQTSKPTVANVPQGTDVKAPAKGSTAADKQAGAPETNAEKRPQIQAMTEQLNAPSRIAHNLTNQSEQAPPSGAVEIGSSNAAAVSGVFASRSPQVKPDDAKPLNISAGVATGRLIRSPSPVYPSIARSAGVSGTVVLSATISKSGMPEGLHVVSGPVMLRQAAVDAVKTWRYKPYMLNNQPVDTETTISVTFALK